MIKLFKTQRINSNAILFGLLLLIQFNSVFARFQHDFFSIPIFGTTSHVSIFVSCILIFSVALLTTNICNRFRLTESYTNLPGLIVVFFSSILLHRLDFHIWMPILLIHVFIFNKLFKASTKNHPEPNYFDCAFLLGTCALLYPPLALLYFALLFSFYIIQPAKFRYFTISIVSFLMPFLFLIIYLVWQKMVYILPLILKSFWLELLHFDLQLIQKTPILYALFLFYVLMSIFFWLGRSYMFQVNQKNVLKTSTTYVVSGVFLFLAFQITGNQGHASLIIPISFLLTYFFFYQNEQLSNVLLLLLFALSLVYPWVSV